MADVGLHGVSRQRLAERDDAVALRGEVRCSVLAGQSAAERYLVVGEKAEDVQEEVFGQGIDRLCPPGLCEVLLRRWVRAAVACASGACALHV